MSGIKRAFDVRNLPQAMNDYRMMSSIFALERVQGETAIESRSVENKPKAPAKFREKVACGQCEAIIFADENCNCMNV